MFSSLSILCQRARACCVCVCYVCADARANQSAHTQTDTDAQARGFARMRAHILPPPPLPALASTRPPHAVYMHIGNGIHCSDTVLVCMCDVMGHGVGVRVMANFVLHFLHLLCLHFFAVCARSQETYVSGQTAV